MRLTCIHAAKHQVQMLSLDDSTRYLRAQKWVHMKGRMDLGGVIGEAECNLNALYEILKELTKTF